jgi:phage repressor protein C with HTH and peptisase S24 domain
VLVYRHQHAVRLKSNLLAVEIGKTSTSMEPLLHPGDIILCDRDDFKPTKPGGIFLVREPEQHGGAKIKRVATKPVDNDLLITFYSENSADNSPEMFSLRGDYNDTITEAIIGRCVWAWQDITGK